MQVAQLSLPARYSAGTHFKTAYGAAHHAADQVASLTDDNGCLRTDASHDQVRAFVNSLSRALSAARELDNLLAGNQPPRRGE
jgi:hypothetical protein